MFISKWKQEYKDIHTEVVSPMSPQAIIAFAIDKNISKDINETNFESFYR